MSPTENSPESTSPYQGPTEVPATNDDGAEAVPAQDGGTRYRLVRLHARGGLGEVFVAVDEELGREVALKRIQDAQAGNPESRRRFLREAEITARLEHPGVVPVHGLVHDAAGQPSYAMRLIEGETLHEAVRRFHKEDGRDPGQRALLLRQLLTRFIEVCNTLAYAHSRGIIHRDLKPANIMLGKFGETLVVDWGLAKPIDGPETEGNEAEAVSAPAPAAPEAGTQMGEAMGTPAFMSPEQAAGRLDQVGPASDVYGLGATLYCLLTGQAPFPDRDSRAVLDKVQKGDFLPPRKVNAKVPAPLEAICLRAMAQRPEDRYASPTALADDLEHWLADEPFASYQESWRQRLARWSRRHRTAVIVAAIGLALTVAAGLGGYLLWKSTEDRRQRQANDYLANLRGATLADENLALSEVRAGRFDSADKILQQALKRLNNETQLESFLSQLKARKNRVHRLVQFYDLAEKAERLTFQEQIPEALTAGKAALVSLGVYDGDPWWAHLPDADLTTGQAAQLKNDAYRLLLMAAGFLALEGLKSPGSPQSAPAFHSALRDLDLAERFRPSRSGGLLKLFCYLGLDEPEKLHVLHAGEPTSAIDYYFLGLVHLGISALSDHPVARFLLAGVGPLVSGLDFKAPLVRAEEYLQKASRLDPRHSYTYLFLGDTLRLANRPQAAELAVNSCVALQPDNAVGYQMRAAVIWAQARQTGAPQLKKQLLERCLADCDAALRLNPANARAYNLRGSAYLARGELDRAIADFREVIRLKPELPEPYFLRAEAYFAQGKPRPALADYGQAIRLVPDNITWLGKRAELHSQLKEYDRAIADYTRAVEMRTNIPALWIGRGTVHAHTKEWAKGAADLGIAVALQPESALLRRQHAALMVRAGLLEKFGSACQRMVKSFASTRDAAAAAHIVAACTQAPLAKADARQVVLLAEKIGAAKPAAWLQFSLGAAYYRNGQFDKAIAALNQADNLAPVANSPPTVWLFLAMAHRHSGQGDKVKEWLDKAELWQVELQGKGNVVWWEGVEFENLFREARAIGMRGQIVPEIRK